MEKAFAYICAPEKASYRTLNHYCREVYRLGYVPICPKLDDGRYLVLDNPDERRDFEEIAREKLARCRMLVVCGDHITAGMAADIGAAQRYHRICTTLEGLTGVKNAEVTPVS